MNIKCPLCGEICETDVDVAIGRRILCPFCNVEFYYEGDAGNLAVSSNVNASSEDATETGGREIRFCSQCGTKIPPMGSFCPSCGRNVFVSEDKTFDADISPIGVDQVVEMSSMNPEKFQKLLYFLKWTLGLSAISYIVGLIDVREYYSVGRLGSFVLSAAFLGMQVWLYFAVANRKSWARKTQIAVIGLGLASYIFGLQFGGADNAIVALLDVVGLLISLYCVYLCFDKQVAALYKPDSELRDARAVTNIAQCIGWWFAGILTCVIAIVWGWCYLGTDGWDRDCSEAAARGSSLARENMIDFVADAAYAKGIEDPVEWATEYVDSEIYKRKAKSRNSRDADLKNSKVLKEVAKHPGGVYVALKILGKILVGLAALVSGIFSFTKNKSSQ